MSRSPIWGSERSASPGPVSNTQRPNKRRSIVRLATVVAAIVGGTSLLTAGPAAAEEVTSTVIVTFDSGVDPTEAAIELEAQGVEVDTVLENALDGAVLTLTESELAELRNDPSIESIDVDVPVQILGDGSVDASSEVYWGLDRIDQRLLPLSGSYSPIGTGSGVRVFVIDTGVRATHAQFGGRVAEGISFIDDGNGTNDCHTHGHGTHVAGTIGGGSSGVARGVTIVPVRVFTCEGWGTMSEVILALDYAIASLRPGETAIANLSLGGMRFGPTDEAVERATQAGIVVVAAAGNNSGDACQVSPAGAPSAVTVGATTWSDVRASFSNMGSCLDLFAPGNNVRSASNASDTSYLNLSGTSMAAPHVAGTAALLAAQGMNATQITRQLLDKSTQRIVTDSGEGSPNRLLFIGEDPVVEVVSSERIRREIGELIDVELGAVGGMAPYSWSLIGGSLPPGVELSADGRVSGIPTEMGLFEANVEVRDWVGTTATGTLSMAIIEPLTIKTRWLVSARVGVAYDWRLKATGGFGTSTWSLVDGALPRGLTLSPDGRIAGTPEIGGRTGFTARVTDELGEFVDVALSIDVTFALVIQPPTVPPMRVFDHQRVTVSAEGGVPPYVWSIVKGEMPLGMSLTDSGESWGRLVGSPIRSGSFGVTLEVRDSEGVAAEMPITLVVNEWVQISTDALPKGRVTTPYEADAVAVGGRAPYTWSLGRGSLPAGLELSEAGRVSGTPQTAGTYTVDLRVEDADGYSVNRELTLIIDKELSIATDSALAAAVGSAYRTVLSAEGLGGPYRWKLVSGSLPSRMTMTADGVISGTPRAVSTSTFTVQVTDPAGRTATKAMTLRIVPKLEITTSSLPVGMVGVPYSAAVRATGGVSGVEVQFQTGVIARGLNIASGGQPRSDIQGTPLEAGTFPMTFVATDANGAKVTKTLTLRVVASGQPQAFARGRAVAEGQGRVSLSWAATGGARGYEVCVSTRSGMCSDWVDAGTSVSHTVTDLKRGQTYFWQVRAFNQHGTTLADRGSWGRFTAR